MERMLMLQPSPRTDHITDDGRELQQLPYPFYVKEDGEVLNPDIMQAGHVIGFQKDLARQQIDIWWEEVWENPELAVRKYLVSTAPDGDGMGVHSIAIDTVRFIGGEQQD